jgi:peptidoglycan/LPS O-acetylase OafA/YrhL
MQEKKRLLWVDGLRGIACFAVFLHHFMLSFYPSSFYGTEKPSLLNGFDTFFSANPLGFIINGNFWVNVFILIASFIPASRVMACRNEDMKSTAGTIVLRRFPRLMIPVAVVSLIKFLLVILLNALNLNYAGISIEHGFIKYMFHACVLLFFRPDRSVIGPLWTIYYIFMAAPIAVTLALPDKKSNKLMPLVYAALLVPVYYVELNFLPVIFGVLLADIKVNRLDGIKASSAVAKWVKYSVSLFMILLGLFLGGYPSHTVDSVFYSFLPESTELPLFIAYHALGAFMLMFGLMLWHEWNLKSVILEKKPALFLGSISMGVFLIHTLLIDFVGYYLFDKLMLSNSYVIVGAVLLVVVSALLILMAWVFKRFVETPAEELCKKIKV